MLPLMLIANDRLWQELAEAVFPVMGTRWMVLLWLPHH